MRVSRPKMQFLCDGDPDGAKREDFMKASAVAAGVR
jgi:hypothetical protein